MDTHHTLNAMMTGAPLLPRTREQHNTEMMEQCLRYAVKKQRRVASGVCDVAMVQRHADKWIARAIGYASR